MNRANLLRSLTWESVGPRWTIEATLVARTGLRVGRGRSLSDEVTDLPVLRDPVGHPFVPGSSLKGVFRSAAERYLRAVAPADDWQKWACDPLDQKHTCLAKRDADRGSAPKPVRAPEKIAAERKRISDNVCLACATFGGMGIRSHARFVDTPLTDATDGPALVTIRDGVGIDRDLARARDGLKYDYEVAVAGSRMKLRVGLDNAQAWQAALLVYVLDEMDAGAVRIGGFGSRGLGEVGVEELAIRRRLRPGGADETLTASEVSTALSELEA